MGNAFCLDQCCTAIDIGSLHNLYEEQISIGVIAVTQTCCEPVLQSSTEHRGMHSALTSAAVHFCCLTAHLYEEQVSIAVTAVTPACSEPVLQSNTDRREMHAWGTHFAKTSAALHWCWVTAVNLFCRASLNSGDCILNCRHICMLGTCFTEQH